MGIKEREKTNTEYKCEIVTNQLIEVAGKTKVMPKNFMISKLEMLQKNLLIIAYT